VSQRDRAMLRAIEYFASHSRSFEMVPFENLVTVFYSHFIATMAVSLAVSEIFSVKEWRELEIWVWGH